MYKFEISAEAEEDLEEIMLYKSGYSPTYAITFIDGLANRFLYRQRRTRNRLYITDY